jgi:autotransporter family porin
MNFIGTGGTVAPKLTTTGTNELLSVTSSTSGTLTLDLTALTDLETATANGTGALALDSSPTSLATVTTGAGADNFAIKTATAIDNENTDKIETVTATVNTGAGNDKVVVKTTGKGETHIDTGEGNDTVIHQSHSEGTTSIQLGAGNDTFDIGVMSRITTKTTIDGGLGGDTLVTNEGVWASADYLLLNTYVSGFEALTVTASGATLDASKLDGFTSISFTNGSATVNKVDGQLIAMVKAEKIAKDDTIGITEVAATQSTNLTVTALDYEAKTSTKERVAGSDLNVVINGASASTVTLAGDDAKLTVGVGAYGTSAYIGTVTLAGDVTTATATLNSTAYAKDGSAITLRSSINVSVTSTELENMTNVTIKGAGSATINAGSLSEDDAVLSTIDVSGMGPLAEVNGLGEPTGVNLSITSITGNKNASEEIILGGAQDTVVTSGSIAKAIDSVTGFSLVASNADDEVVNSEASDKIKTGVAGANFVFDKDADFTSLTEALLLLGDSKDSNNANQQNHIFHADGNTYVYIDNGTANSGTEGYSDDDILIELTGIYDGVLLAQVITA